jgi:hypothetical protein
MDKLAERTQLPAQPLAVATRIHFWQIEPNLRDPFNLASKPAGSINRDTGRAYLLLNACGDARPRALAAHQILQGLRDLDPSIPIPMRHVPAFVACGLILAATGTTQCRAGSLRDDRARGRAGGRGLPRPRRGLSGADGGARNGHREPHVPLPHHHGRGRAFTRVWLRLRHLCRRIPVSSGIVPIGVHGKWVTAHFKRYLQSLVVVLLEMKWQILI